MVTPGITGGRLPAVLRMLNHYWKVKNTGHEAIDAREPRGELERGESTRYEQTPYVGSHYVEVCVVKDGVCVARDRQPVIIQLKMGV